MVARAPNTPRAAVYTVTNPVDYATRVQLVYSYNVGRHAEATRPNKCTSKETSDETYGTTPTESLKLMAAAPRSRVVASATHRPGELYSWHDLVYG